jgi:hypothetical protein
MKTKMIALFAVLVLSVALAGSAYAAWTATINVTGSVSTGNVAVQVTEVVGSNSQIDVAWTADSFDVDVVNAYPGWIGQVEVTVANTGSLPVIIGAISVTEDGSSSLDDYLIVTVGTLPESIPAQTSATVTVTLEVIDSPLVPESATASYAGTVTFILPP